MSTIFKRMFKTKTYTLSTVAVTIGVFRTRPKFIKVCYQRSRAMFNSVSAKKEILAIGQEGCIPPGVIYVMDFFLDNKDYKPLSSDVPLSVPSQEELKRVL